MTHKTFLIIGLLAITNLLTVLALNVTQKSYDTLQSQASLRQAQIPEMMPDASENMATISVDDFTAEEDTMTDGDEPEMAADYETADETTADDGALNVVSQLDFDTGMGE